MKSRKKFAAYILLALAALGPSVRIACAAERDPSNAVHSLDGRDWISRFPSSDPSDLERCEVASSDIYEIPVSKLFSAIRLLEGKDAEAVPLSIEAAKIFLGGHYSCPEGKRPYLVRGKFAARGGGEFKFEQAGRNLWIEQLLGGFTSGDAHLKTAFIVNSDSPIEFVGCLILYWG